MIKKPLSYKDIVYEKIKEDIITGVYSQGEVLNERNLADELGVSRTPIREALQLLKMDGWVINELYKGTIVRTFDVEYVMNAQKVRKVLEMLAVEDAITNISDKNIYNLIEILDEQEKWLSNYDPAEFMKLDRKFHETIYLLSNNDILLNLLQNLNDIIRFFGIKVLMIPERSTATIMEHKRILEAIKNKNVNLAKKSMDYHLSMTGDAIYKYAMKQKNNKK